MYDLPDATHALLDNALEGTGHNWIDDGARPWAWICCGCACDDSHVHDREPCLGCSHYPCPHCTLLDHLGRPIKTLGGQNLRPDRLEVGGWQCCDCGDIILRSLPWNGQEETEVSMHIGGVRYHVGFECGCRHFICGDCTLLNPYGEELGLIGHDSFQLVPRRPLHEHKQWCDDQLAQAYAAVDGYCGHIFQSKNCNALYGTSPQQPIVHEAKTQVEEMEDLVEDLDTWVDEFKEAIDDALCNEGNSDEDDSDDDGSDEDDNAYSVESD